MTGRRSLLAFLCLVAVTAAAGVRGAPAASAAEHGLASLFARRAAVSAPAGRLVRLELPPAVLSACRRDLSDLRIVGPGGTEVPYLLHRAPGPGERLEARATVRPRLLGAERHTEGRRGAPPRFRETYELSTPPPPPAGQRWDLVLATGRSRFVRRIQVAVAGEPVVDGSVFRLPGPGRERLRLPLPGVSGDRLTVVLEGEGGGFLEPSLRYERVRSIAGGESARVPLPVLERHSAGGRTTIELERPGSLVPDRLVLTTDTPAFDRRVEVWDEGPGAVREPLARDSVFRLPGRPAVEGLAVGLRPARGDRLRLVVDDGDSPPLAGLEVQAAVPRPTLLFALPAPPGVDPEAGPRPGTQPGTGPEAEAAGGAEAEATLYFGGGRTFRPRYDLEDLRPVVGRTTSGSGAELLERLADPARLPEAHLGAAEANPSYDREPALAFAMHPGAAFDPALYGWRRHLRAEPSPEGLVRLRLGLDDLARAREDLADLRISDGASRQWPYLLERGLATARRALRVGPPETRDGRSAYELTPSASPATLAGLDLEVGASFFDRAYTLEAVADGRRAVLARGRLARRAGDPRPLAVGFPATRAESLVLIVEDGSDAPLDLTAATGRFPVPEVFFAAPPGGYELLLGYPEAEAPRYELSRVREVVLAAAAGGAESGPLEPNPAFRRGRRWLTTPGLQGLLLWGALAAAVVVLAALTLRLAQR